MLPPRAGFSAVTAAAAAAAAAAGGGGGAAAAAVVADATVDATADLLMPLVLLGGYRRPQHYDSSTSI